MTSGYFRTMGYYWSQVVGVHELTFFSIPKYFKSPSASPKKNVQPTFELLTPLSNNQHTFHRKICIKNPAQSANLHHRFTSGMVSATLMMDRCAQGSAGSKVPSLGRTEASRPRPETELGKHKSVSGFYSC